MAAAPAKRLINVAVAIHPPMPAAPPVLDVARLVTELV